MSFLCARDSWHTGLTYSAIVHVNTPLKLVEVLVSADLGPTALPVTDDGVQGKRFFVVATPGAHFSTQLPSNVLVVETGEGLDQNHEHGHPIDAWSDRGNHIYHSTMSRSPFRWGSAIFNVHHAERPPHHQTLFSGNYEGRGSARLPRLIRHRYGVWAAGHNAPPAENKKIPGLSYTVLPGVHLAPLRLEAFMVGSHLLLHILRSVLLLVAVETNEKIDK